MDTIIRLAKIGGILFLSHMAISCAAQTAADEKMAANSDMQKMVCHSEMPLGSRLPIRTCKPKASWIAEAEENEKQRREMSRKRLPEAAPKAPAGRQ